MEKIKREIAGEIVLSENAGQAMRKWREIFQISQVELANFLKINPSTVSDYEANRRESPGVKIVRRFVNALFEIDRLRGGQIIEKLSEREKNISEYFETYEFTRGITIKEFSEIIEGKILTNLDVIESKKVYGYTIIDSIKVILDMPSNYFPKMYGNITERAFIFTGVSTGRSPMVVIRVTPSKPNVVVLHGLNEVDKLALKISEKEKIPIIITKLEISKIKERLSKV